ncbi:unnamed protein product [Scytosiphon promiscuus]
MADIQSSLRRLQESIRGLSDASALVGAVNLSEDGEEQPLETSAAGASPGSVARSRGACSSNAGRQGTAASSSSSAFDDASGQEYHGRHDGVGGELSPDGGSAKQDGQHDERSFLSSIPRDLRESAEIRAARELEDLRQEKESLQVMKQQLAAVHQLRVDLQRKDSVIQSLQIKVQEGQSARDREGRLEAHCHLLEKRCSYLEASNGEHAERLAALDQESRARVDGLMRETDDLRRQLQDLESELGAQGRRFEAADSAHRRELAAAQAEGAEARRVAGDLKASLEQASAQAQRRRGRWSDMEKLVGTSTEDRTDYGDSLIRARLSLSRAPLRHRAGAARRCAEPLEQLVDSDERYAFVELSERWCGNEILALTWVEVSKALEALEVARLGRSTALRSLRDSKRKVGGTKEETRGAKCSLVDLREQEMRRLERVEAQLRSTSAQLAEARERARTRDRHVHAAWTQLLSVGAVSPPAATTTPLRSSARASDGSDGDSRLTSITEGIRKLTSEWTERGHALETLTRRLREDGVRRDEERARLETLAEAAKQEAESRAEELARLVVEFETRAACAEAGMDEKVGVTDLTLPAARFVAGSSTQKKNQPRPGACRLFADAAADTARGVSEAAGAADLKASEAIGAADRRAAEAERDAERRVGEAAAAAGPNRCCFLFRSCPCFCLHCTPPLLRKFVGPLHRLCLELREQKRFLSRSYRRDSPLQQAELFAVAAAVSDKDYWCLLSPQLSSSGGSGGNFNDAAALPVGALPSACPLLSARWWWRSSRRTGSRRSPGPRPPLATRFAATRRTRTSAVKLAGGTAGRMRERSQGGRPVRAVEIGTHGESAE